MARKSIQIENVEEVKRGQNAKGKPWTLYKVVAADGETFTTFDGKYLGMQGEVVDIEYEVTEKTGKTGKVFRDNRIVEDWQKKPKAAVAGPQTNTARAEDPQLATIIVLLRQIVEKLGIVEMDRE